MRHPTSIERAYELARSGQYECATQIGRALSAEGFNAAQIEGPALKRELTDLCRAAQGKSARIKGRPKS